MKKKLLISLLIVISLMTMLFTLSASAAVIKAGSCGTNLTWTLTDTGVLTVSGTGAMTDYTTSSYGVSNSSTAPWYSSYRTSIKEVIINEGVTTIGSYAFAGCTALTTVTVHPGVKGIGVYAFYGCTALASINLPDSVLTIGTTAFNNTAYYNKTANWENNVLYIDDYLIKAKTSLCDGYDVKEGTKIIADYAFYDCDMLISITIPDSVTDIGQYAFNSCDILTRVTFGDNSRLTEIRPYVFYGCIRLTEMDIPDSVTSIGSRAFSTCSSLTSITIPDSVTSIGQSAFYDCSKFKDVYYTGTEAQWKYISIGSSNSALTNATKYYDYIPTVASGDCGDGLTWTLDNNGKLTVSGSGAMYNNWYSSTAVPWSSYRTSIKNVVISDGVTNIGSRAFYLCSNLESITIPESVTKIGDLTFYSCSKIQEITVPKSVTAIGSTAFKNCGNLTIKVYYKSAAHTYADKNSIPYSLIDVSGFATVTWKNYDGTVLETDADVTYGTIPEYNGITPVRENTAKYVYTFKGWDTAIVPVSGDITYTAVFDSAVNTYTVMWINHDGSVLETDVEVEYGTLPEYNGETPVKDGDGRYTYTFNGWDKEIAEVTGNVFYTAVFTSDANSFTVTWKNYDGTVLETDTEVQYGTMPEYNGTTPVKENTAEYIYTFGGWDKTVVNVTGDVTYTAVFDTALNSYTVTWKNYDGTVLETDTEVQYGTLPEYNGETPVKESDGEFTYTFKGWDKEITEVTGDITYTADFDSQEIVPDEPVDPDEPIDPDEPVDPDEPTETVITVKGGKARMGKTVDVVVSIERNCGIAGMLLDLSYDTEALTLTEVVGGEALSGLTLTQPGALTSPCKFLWDGETSDDSDGDILILTFTVNENTVVGEYDITLSYINGDIYDEDFNDVDVEIVNGKIIVPNFITGDLDDDGTIGPKDITLLRRYIVGGYGELDIIEEAADINGDGVIRPKDITLLRRYIVGGYGVELD